MKKKRIVAMVAAMLLIALLITVAGATEGVKTADTGNAEYAYLSDLEWVSAECYPGYSATKDTTCMYKNSIRIAGVYYAKGLSTHPTAAGTADIVYDVDGLGLRSFGAVVGKDMDACATQSAAKSKIRFQVLADDVVAADSGVLEFGQSAELKADISDCSTLTLRVLDGGDGISCDTASWGSAVVSTAAVDDLRLPDAVPGIIFPKWPEVPPVYPTLENVTFLSDIPYAGYVMWDGSSGNASSRWEPGLDKTFQYGSGLSVAGVSYSKGISMHPDAGAPAEIHYNISGKGFVKFGAVVGKDADAGAASDATGSYVRFQVLLDGDIVADSGNVAYGESKELTADITGGHLLTLRLSDGGDTYACDTADWANAFISKSAATPIPEAFLNTAPPQENAEELLRADTAYISDLTWGEFGGMTDSGIIAPVTRDTNITGVPISIWGDYFKKGVGMHAKGSAGAFLEVNIAGLGFKTFAAYVGISEQGQALPYAKVKFRLYADNVQIGESPEMRYTDKAYLLTADITNAKALRMVIDDCGDSNSDMAVWGNALITKLDSSASGELAGKDTFEFSPRHQQVHLSMGDSLPGYPLRTQTQGNGTIVSTAEELVLPGELVNFTITAEQGWRIRSLVAVDLRGERDVLGEYGAPGAEKLSFTYTMPAQPVVLCAVFEPTTQEMLQLNAAYLKPEETLNVLYTAKIPDGFDSPYMVFSFMGNEITVTDYVRNELGEYCFEFRNLPPQCMGEQLDAALYVSSYGEKLEVAAEPFTVKDYCETLLAQQPNEKTTALLTALLRYGAAAQSYTGFRTNDLVTAELADPASDYIGPEKCCVSYEGTADLSVDWIAPTVSLENSPAMEFVFRADDLKDLTVRLSANGRIIDFTEADFKAFREEENLWVVTFEGIKATEFEDSVTACFLRGGEQFGRKLSFSVNTFVYAMQNNQTIPNYAELVRALYNYGVAAKAYVQSGN